MRVAEYLTKNEKAPRLVEKSLGELHIKETFMYENIVPQGWQCPICKRVYSPSMPMCNYCGELKFTYSTNLAEIVNLDKKDTENKE